jgi:hypothetical protein
MTTNDDLNDDLVAGFKKGSPQFKHDCDVCSFYAQLNYDGRICDIYLCKESPKVRTIIARYGNDGCQYHSGELFECVELTRLDRFALSYGLELNEAEKDRLLKCFFSMDKQRWKREDYNLFAPGEDKENALGPNDWYNWKY